MPFNLIILFPSFSTPNNKAHDSIEIYGNFSTSEEQVRLAFSILQQLLPTVKRDLYENVDGKKASGSDPEDSPLLPGSVKMHREANTSDKDLVLIKNHFNSSDFKNMLPEIDLNLKYSDFAFIKKSNGMVSEGRSYLAEQLNFGEAINIAGGAGISMMKISLTSHVSLIETHYFGQVEFEAVNFHLFVKLVVPKSEATISVNDTQSQTPSNVSLPSQQYVSDNSSAVSLKRSKRSVSANASMIGEIWRRIGPVCLNINRTFTLFDRRVLGIRVKAVLCFSVNIDGVGVPEVEVKLKLMIGRQTLVVFCKKFTIQLLQGIGIHLHFELERRLVSILYVN